MAQIIDASVAIAWCARRQATPLTEAALSAVSERGGHVPSIFWFEVLYGFAGLISRGILDPADAETFQSSIGQLQLTVDPAKTATEMIVLHRLARQFDLSIYDAAYLELALRLGLPLATRDASLVRAATAAGATLFAA